MSKMNYNVAMRLITLGTLKFEGSSFNRHKPLLLLSFLALEGTRPRRYLAELFYAEAKSPLNSLSRALSHVRDVDPELLEADSLNVGTTVACDAKELERLLDKNRLEEAVAAYSGPFLQGTGLELGAELEEWVLVTREHIAGRVREAHLRLGEAHAARGDFDAAARHAEGAYTLRGADELEPEDFERTYTLLTAGGSPQAADIRKEAAGFGIRLLLDSDAAKAKLFVEQHAPLPPHNLPRRRTSFVGRAAELDDIAAVFEDTRHRLLTLLGPGGVGKSRLAVEAAYRQLREARFKDGTTLVELDSVAAPELIPGAVAEALKLELRGPDDPLVQITKHVGTDARLFVLDNFEHLIAGAGLIRDLLDACPRLSILVTSRERLNLADEWVLELAGLRISDENAPGSDALNLFVQRAKRARLGFSLTHEELPHAQAICDLVGGFPLGIELAAVWIKLLSPADIAAEIKQSLSFLASPARDVSERQRSINAAFDYSWKLLSPAEQAVMRKLSVFNGGFRKEAAAQVADASLPILASLVDKSLLIAKGGSRYERHALLFQFAQEKLAGEPEEEAETKARHAHYFHDLLKNAEAELRGPGAKEAMDAIEAEFENIRLAWGWAVEHEDANSLRAMVIPLRQFFDLKGRFEEGATLFGRAINALKAGSSHQTAVASLLVEKACLIFRRGDHGRAKKLALRGLELMPPRPDPRDLIEGHLILGALCFYDGDYPEAKRHWLTVVELAEANGYRESLARALNYLGIISAQLNDHHQAESYYRKAVTVSRQHEDRASLVSALNNYATYKLNIGDLSGAQHLFEEGLDLARKANLRTIIPYLLNGLARVNYRSKAYAVAVKLGAEALANAQEVHEPLLEAKIRLETLAKLEMAMGQPSEAYRHYLRALEIVRDINALPLILEAIVGVAEVQLKYGRVATAAELLHFAAHHSALTGTLSDLTEQLKAELENAIPKRDLNRAERRGKELSLSDAINYVLTGQGPKEEYSEP